MTGLPGRRRRASLLLPTAVSAALLVAACGGGGTTDDSAASSTTAASAPSSTTETDPGAAGDTADETPTASDIGVTADTITIGLITVNAEGLPTNLPIILDTDEAEYGYGPLVDAINEGGGIHGRQVVIEEFRWSPFEIPASLDAVCLAAGDDAEIFAAITPSYFGEAVPCLTGDKGVPTLFASTQVDAVMDRTGGNALVLEGVAGQIALDTLSILHDEGLLEADKIAFVVDGFAGNAELIDLVTPLLDEFGIEHEVYEIEADALGSSPTIAVATQNMAQDDIEFVYPFVNSINTAGLMSEADLAGWSPTWIVSDHAERTSLLVPNNAPTAQLRNVVGASAQLTDTGETLGTEAQACIDFRNAIEGAPPIEAGSPTLFYLNDTCVLVNVLEQVLTEAGVNPTRADFVAAAQSLGTFQNFVGADLSFAPGKSGAPDSYRVIEYAETCPATPNGCFVAASDFIAAPGR